MGHYSADSISKSNKINALPYQCPTKTLWDTVIDKSSMFRNSSHPIFKSDLLVLTGSKR